MFRGFVMVAMFRKKLCVRESEMVLFMRVRDLFSTQTHQSNEIGWRGMSWLALELDNNFE
jgi:hypothetical protein